MRNKTVLMSLSVIVLLGMAMLLGMDAGVSAQIDPTSQQQTIDAAVAQRLNATATAQAQQAVAFEATLVEAAIQTAVAESVRSTEVAFMASTLAALGFDTRPVTANADWTPIELDFDGVAMVLVPAGCFEMGMPEDVINALKTQYSGNDEFFEALGPVHSQCIQTPFWLDKTEVAQAQFVAHGGVKANPNYFPGDNRPVEQITWFEARDYCEARGGRLPTEAEWEYAARGPDGLAYPWGDEFIGDNVVYGENSNSQTAEVGSKPAGASWVGAMDMSGNVWEWMSSLYKPYPYVATDGREADSDNRTDMRVLRGGSWDNNVTDSFGAANRNLLDGSNFTFGFRCALS